MLLCFFSKPNNYGCTYAHQTRTRVCLSELTASQIFAKKHQQFLLDFCGNQLRWPVHQWCLGTIDGSLIPSRAASRHQPSGSSNCGRGQKGSQLDDIRSWLPTMESKRSLYASLIWMMFLQVLEKRLKTHQNSIVLYRVNPLNLNIYLPLKNWLPASPNQR